MAKTTFTKDEAGLIRGAVREFGSLVWPTIYRGFPSNYKRELEAKHSTLILSIYVSKFLYWIANKTEGSARREIGETVASWAFDNDVSLQPTQSENLVKVIYRHLLKRGLDE